MKNLLIVELHRLRWRRAVVLLAGVAVLLPLVIFSVTAWNTRPISEAERQQARILMEQNSPQSGIEREINRCVKHPDRFGLMGVDGDVRVLCEEMLLPQEEWYYSRSTLNLESELTGGSVVAIGVLLTMLLLLLGTTFVGHDWNSGSMSNQLLFEPRRARVWAAKAAVVLALGLVLAGAVLTAHWTALWMIADQRGLELPDDVVSTGYLQVLRTTLLAAFAGLGGYALTMLFRSTVATLGVLFAVSIAAPLLLAVLNFEGNQRLMPQHNFTALALDGVTLVDYSSPDCADGYTEQSTCEIRLTKSDATAYFGVLLLLAGAPSLVSFRRRDVP